VEPAVELAGVADAHRDPAVAEQHERDLGAFSGVAAGAVQPVEAGFATPDPVLADGQGVDQPHEGLPVVGDAGLPASPVPGKARGLRPRPDAVVGDQQATPVQKARGVGAGDPVDVLRLGLDHRRLQLLEVVMQLPDFRRGCVDLGCPARP
jgi:hypothetical protein